VETFKNCPYKFHLRYRENLKVIDNYDADNPLILGTAVHTAIEEGLEAAEKKYFEHFPVITDEQINEMVKLEAIIPNLNLPEGGVFEEKIDNEDFIGFVDYLVPVEGKKTWFDLYDFKYSNNESSYLESGQLHEYKFFYELTHRRMHIRDLYFVFIPKLKTKIQEGESVVSYRRRIYSEASKLEAKIVRVEFDYRKVADFLLAVKHINEMTEPKMCRGWLCNWCDYQDYCNKGLDYMLLPENKRRQIDTINKRVIWIYGVPFCGKTTFANNFPDPLMLNTDGNIKFVDAPYIHIKDTVTVEGRMTKRTLAWENFKDAILELEKKQNTFKTIVVDLLEDTYEHCRIFMYNKMGITHESDNSFKAWDMVRTEFLSTLKRLMNMDYENIILISHEDTSKDVTKKSGDKITAIKPNLAEKVATKVAGMVDIVARITDYKFTFKNDEFVFGGGRLKVRDREIPLDVKALFKVYDEAFANGDRINDTKNESSEENVRRRVVESVPQHEVGGNKGVHSDSGKGNDGRNSSDIGEQPARIVNEPPKKTWETSKSAEIEAPRRRRVEVKEPDEVIEATAEKSAVAVEVKPVENIGWYWCENVKCVNPIAIDNTKTLNTEMCPICHTHTLHKAKENTRATAANERLEFLQKNDVKPQATLFAEAEKPAEPVKRRRKSREETVKEAEVILNEDEKVPY